MEPSSSEITSSFAGDSCADDGVKRWRKKRHSFFKKHGPVGFSSSSGDADVSAIEFDHDLTPGSLEIWVDLPDEIKYDPALAPFKQLYEQQHGKLQGDAEAPEGDKTIFYKKKNSLGAIGETNELNTNEQDNSGDRLMNPGKDEENNNDTKPVEKKLGLLEQAGRVVKLSALVAGWVLLMVALLMNHETTDVLLHAAVHGIEVKEYSLPLLTEDSVSVAVTLTGPFSESDNLTSSDYLHVWLVRTLEAPDGVVFEQNSSTWVIPLQPPDLLDFSPSVSESQTLALNSIRRSDRLEGNNGSNDEVGVVMDVEGNVTSLTLRMQSSPGSTVPLTVTYQLNPMTESDGILYSSVLLIILYVLIVFEIINRTIAALLSSSLAIAVLALSGARPSLPELVSWLDVETLLLLFSMMLLVAILAETGMFDYLAVVAFEMTGGRTWPLINCLCLFTAVFSTFLDNVTTVLLMTPVTIRLCEVMQLNPVPVLMSMVVFSNVGGAATPVGDPPNVIIASHPAVLRENINFTTFTVHMGVGILLVCVQTYVQLRFMFRDMSKLRHSVPFDVQEMRQEIAVWRRAAASLASYSRDEDLVRKALEKKVERLRVSLRRRESRAASAKRDPNYSATLQEMKQKYRIRDKPLLIKSCICVSFVVVVFFLHAIPQLQGLSLGWTALLGALLLLLLAEHRDLEPLLARVEWSTLLFFAALFVLMEALSKLGLISWIGRLTSSLILQVEEESRLAVALMLVLWVSGLASAFVDNIPLTTMMVRVTARLAEPGGLALPLAPLTWALSFGACLGGNGTLIGASANVVCAGVAEQHGYRFTFLQYLKVGFPVMIGNLLVATVYLLVCHCLFSWH